MFATQNRYRVLSTCFPAEIIAISRTYTVVKTGHALKSGFWRKIVVDPPRQLTYIPLDEYLGVICNSIWVLNYLDTIVDEIEEIWNGPKGGCAHVEHIYIPGWKKIKIKVVIKNNKTCAFPAEINWYYFIYKHPSLLSPLGGSMVRTPSTFIEEDATTQTSRSCVRKRFLEYVVRVFVT